MALYLIGIGLHDEKDISVRGLEIVRKCDVVYLEHYTSVLSCSIKEMEQFYGRPVLLADRDAIEKGAEDFLLKQAATKEVALLVVGDVFAATTHADLFLRAKKAGLQVEVVHNASVISAVGMTGLEVYKFGKTLSIPFHHKGVTSPFDGFKANDKQNLHTLFLLDLDPKTGKFLTIGEALSYLVSCGLDEKRLAVGCASLGAKMPEIKVGTATKLLTQKFSLYPQCLIIPSEHLHFKEEEMLNEWSHQ
ncbi:diphthine synthase [Candidatus Woesearchaeota archaeon]|nr:diphthine synthase [Candidatus Woesearchaeota archaeon]